jgi:hypothetical protein
MARSGKKVLQFLEGGRYNAVVADEKVYSCTHPRINPITNYLTAITGQK